MRVSEIVSVFSPEWHYVYLVDQRGIELHYNVAVERLSAETVLNFTIVRIETEQEDGMTLYIDGVF